MGRVAFVAAIAPVIAAAYAYRLLLDDRWPGVVGFVVACALLFTAACLLCKRLHDRGRAGWWAALILAAWGNAFPWPQGAVGWTFGAVVVVAAIDLAVLPGRPGANRFGPSLAAKD